MNRFPTLSQAMNMADQEFTAIEKEWYEVAAVVQCQFNSNFGPYESEIQFQTVSDAWEYYNRAQLRPGDSISIWDGNLVTQRGHTTQEEIEFCWYQKWQDDGGAEGFAWYQKEQFLRGGYIPLS